MSNPKHDLERLIVRHLDSELTEEEELELNRELIRNPEAQQLLDDYRRADDLAVAALNRIIPDDGAVKSAPLTMPPIAARRVGYYRAWWIIPGAVAAAILALVIPNPSVGPDIEEPVTITQVDSRPLESISRPRPGSPPEMMHNVGTSPLGPQIKRNTGQEVFGVVDDEGNVYWIQVDRIRTMKRPRHPVSGRSANEAM
ncbi:MAG: hypothetical protein ACYTFA_11710 [Planctomycetota bacterium]|jgi:hypothetical protein